MVNKILAINKFTVKDVNDGSNTCNEIKARK